MHRESWLYTQSAQDEQGVSPLLVKQDFHTAPALPKFILEADACVLTYFKEWTESKQFFCYDN